MDVLLWLLLAVPLIGGAAVSSRAVVPDAAVTRFGVTASGVTLGDRKSVV